MPVAESNEQFFLRANGFDDAQPISLV